ncbi:hypothetical protein C8J31_10282 [Rhizobium sp. PP-CC-2G-626]|nr:hypothetical protein C8J31_10282 [Rhizobium sp. PP-CC-2G-626]
MIPVWPAELPKPNRPEYSASINDPRQPKLADQGPPGWRRKTSAVARTVTLAIEVTRDEKAIFDDFHERVTSFGSLPFRMPDPVTDGWAMLTSDGAPMLTIDGQPMLMGAWWLCLFGEQPPRETIGGVKFKIAFSVTVMP